MTEREWPYSLPIWREFHRAASPDGELVAKIDPAWEVSMSNPTSGTLCVSNGLHLARCNPSFIWSDDSRFLAVPQYFQQFGIFRRQRLLVVWFEKHRVYASRRSAWYFQPESFSAGRLVVSTNPTGRAGRTGEMEFRIPDDLPRAFPRELSVPWPTGGKPSPVVRPLSEGR
jgi:hypothetical protein